MFFKTNKTIKNKTEIGKSIYTNTNKIVIEYIKVNL